MITAEMVKELRERTGSGMMDCKKALNETNGDVEKAIRSKVTEVMVPYIEKYDFSEYLPKFRFSIDGNC